MLHIVHRVIICKKNREVLNMQLDLWGIIAIVIVVVGVIGGIWYENAK